MKTFKQIDPSEELLNQLATLLTSFRQEQWVIQKRDGKAMVAMKMHETKLPCKGFIVNALVQLDLAEKIDRVHTFLKPEVSYEPILMRKILILAQKLQYQYNNDRRELRAKLAGKTESTEEQINNVGEDTSLEDTRAKLVAEEAKPKPVATTQFYVKDAQLSDDGQTIGVPGMTLGLPVTFTFKLDGIIKR